ncbi:GPP34 family phosphoprotein [Streptomyces sp. NPDC101160]|uniref:GOLPH3/VPS74 family protein n=1 Tax=Streptomyces sp. NPDC101160 TaxID=3366118 RepID=UPI003804D1E3
MTTARDLLMVVLDGKPGREVRLGELSLALAGAELVDLLGADAVALRAELVVPVGDPVPSDDLLARALASLRREEPYETVGDWLWRRGDGLAEAYLTALEAEGALTRRRRRGLPLADGVQVREDSPARRRAAELWSSGDPVLVSLAEELGLRAEQAPEPDRVEALDGSVTLVLAAVGDALLELEGVRQRRTVEQAAFDNVWRAPG